MLYYSCASHSTLSRLRMLLCMFVSSLCHECGTCSCASHSTLSRLHMLLCMFVSSPLCHECGTYSCALHSTLSRLRMLLCMFVSSSLCHECDAPLCRNHACSSVCLCLLLIAMNVAVALVLCTHHRAVTTHAPVCVMCSSLYHDLLYAGHVACFALHLTLSCLRMHAVLV